MNSLLLVRFLRNKPLAQLWSDASSAQARGASKNLQSPTPKTSPTPSASTVGHTTFILRHPSTP